MSLLQAIVLGLLEGLTEFIPVSSTAHLRIVPALLGWEDPGAAFSAVIQLSTLVAALVYFWAEIRALVLAALRSLVSAEARATPHARMAWAIAAGNVPVVVLGLGLRHFIESGARSLLLIGTMLIAVALALAAAERVARQILRAQDLSFWQIQVIGVFQALALIPGASRSGSTILGGLLLGMKREEATRFSFLLGMPAIFGAGLFQLAALLRDRADAPWMALLVGLAVAGVSSYWSIGFLLRYLQTRTTMVFVVYRVLAGAAIIALAVQGVIR